MTAPSPGTTPRPTPLPGATVTRSGCRWAASPVPRTGRTRHDGAVSSEAGAPPPRSAADVVEPAAAAVIAQLRAQLQEARERAAHLERALLSGRRIGMAMGVLMASLRIREQEAFARLRAASQARNVKLRDIAEEVILTGTLES